MTGTDLDGVRFFGRPFKPVPLGLAVIMATLLVYNTLNIGIFTDRIGGDVVAVASGLAFALLVVSWWLRSQRMLEAGLFLTALTYIGRTSYLMFVKPEAEGVALGVGIAIIAAGSWLLERDESRRQRAEGTPPWSPS